MINVLSGRYWKEALFAKIGGFPDITPFRSLFIFSALSAMALMAAIMHYLEITTLPGGFLFAFALLGLAWPSQLLAVFLFLIALKHRDFAYVSMDFGIISIHATEWVLLILFISAVPKIKKLGGFILPTVLVFLYFIVGFLLLLFTLPIWGALPAIRDFAIVYYSLFVLTVFIHIRTLPQLKSLILAVVLGTIPNLIAEIGNFLYGTLPMTYDQKNYSMRNSFYYLSAIGFCLPFLARKSKKVNTLPTVYIFFATAVILLYTYGKTAMIMAAIISIIYIIPRIKELPVVITGGLAAIFVLGLLLTPAGKTHPFHVIFSDSTYAGENRIIMAEAALRDFAEHPYGIGFGTPIFGEHSRLMIKNTEELHSLHNSYLTVLRRTGFEGFAVFLSILAAAMVSALSAYRTAGYGTDEKKTALGIILAWICACAFAFPHVALEGPFFGAPFWIFTGFMFLSRRILLPDSPINRDSEDSLSK